MKELKKAYLISLAIFAGIFVISSIAFAAPTFNILGNYAGVAVNGTTTANANFTASGTIAFPNLTNTILGTDGNGKLVATTTSAGTGSVSTSSDPTQYNFPYWFNTTGGLSGTSTMRYDPTTGAILIGTSTAPTGYLLNIATTSQIFFINSNGQIGIGGSSTTMQVGSQAYPADLSIHNDAGSAFSSEVEIHKHATNAGLGGGANLFFARSQGTMPVPLVVNSGNYAYSISGLGYDGSIYQQSTRIDSVFEGTPSSTQMAGRLVFSTTPTTGTSTVERFRIDSTGLVQTMGVSSSSESRTPSSTAGTLTVGTLNGVLKGTTGAVGTATNGTDYTLVTTNTCASYQIVTGVSATGTVTCSPNTPSSTIPSPGNPTATISTTAVNGTANSYMRSDGSPALGSQYASSSVSINMYDVTSTAPYKYARWRSNRALTLTEVTCNEYAAATTTIELSKVSSIATTTSNTLMVLALTCGQAGNTTSTFASSSISYGDSIIANVTSSVGTPLWTAINLFFSVN